MVLLEMVTVPKLLPLMRIPFRPVRVLLETVGLPLVIVTAAAVEVVLAAVIVKPSTVAVPER